MAVKAHIVAQTRVGRTMAKIEGGRVCGKMRYSAEAEPAFVGICHCRN